MSLRNQRSRRVIWVTMLTIGFGIGTLITSISLMRGFQESVLDRILHIYGHMDVHSNNLENDISRIKNKSWYKKHIQINEKQSIASFNNEHHGVKLIGLNQDGCNHVIQDKWIERNSAIKSSDNMPAVMIGTKLANNLGLNIGSEFKLFIPHGINSNRINIKELSAKVGGIFKLGFHSFDNNVIFLIGSHLDNYSLGFEQKQYVFYTKSPEKIDNIIDDFHKSSKFASIWSWKDTNPSLKQMFNMQNIILAVFIGMFILCCMMQSTNSLWMLISERVYDISLLKAFGASNWQIFSLFAYLSLFMSLGSVAFGMVIGFGLNYVFPKLYLLIQKYGYTMIHEESFGFSEFYPKISCYDLSMICIISFLVMMIILLRIARKSNNIEIIKGLD